MLPRTFANVTVIIEQVSETELRIRKAGVIAKDELPFAEESAAPLTDRDRDHFFSLIANPPAPTSALKKAASRHQARRD